MEEGELSEEEDYGVYMDENEVPPGKWRVGINCDKTKVKLFMRLATKGLY